MKVINGRVVFLCHLSDSRVPLIEMIVTWPVFFLESQDSEYAKLSEKEQSRDIK
jgi:hypothetical protein